MSDGYVSGTQEKWWALNHTEQLGKDNSRRKPFKIKKKWWDFRKSTEKYRTLQQETSIYLNTWEYSCNMIQETQN